MLCQVCHGALEPGIVVGGHLIGDVVVPGIVARWQNLIPSFPWIAPVWRAPLGAQSKERKGSNFAV